MLKIFQRSKQSGFSLLEQAVALPVILMFIGGALDITTLLQSYSALREGVNASLRCTYTVDGICVESQPDSRPRMFNYYQVTREQEYLVDKFDFRGTASWINKPAYLYSNFQAEVLNEVTYQAQSSNVSIARRYFPASRVGSYTLRTATLPYITGNARNPVPHFRGTSPEHSANPQGRFPHTGLSISGVRLRSNDSRSMTASAEFTVPLQSHNIFPSNFSETPVNADQRPEFQKAKYTSDRVAVAIQITGNKRDTNVGSLGGVSIELQRYEDNSHHWQTVKGLGAQVLGRAADESTQANFVIRGLPASFIGPMDDYSELHDYSPLQLATGGRYRLQFNLTQTSGTVGWQGEEIRIFYPVDEVRIETFECLGGMTPCSPAATCQTNAPIEIFTLAPRIEDNLPPLRYGPPIFLEACSTGFNSLEEKLANHGISECAANFEVLSDPGNCPVQVATLPCPAIGTSSVGDINFGVSEIPDSDGLIHNSQSALSICPPATLGIDTPPISPHWSVITSALPFAQIGPSSDGTLLATQDSCSLNNLWPANSNLGSYPHLSFQKVLHSYSPEYTAPVDPAVIKSDPSSGYNCDEFQIAEEPIDVPPNQATAENRGSLFYGSQVMPGCEWKAALKEDAVRYKLMLAQAYFEISEPVLSTEKARFPEEPSSCIDPNPEFAWSAPRGRILISGGPYMEPNQPNVCTQPGISCAAEFAGFGPGTGGSTTYNFEQAAEYFGFNEIQAYYPRARWNCSERDCVKLEVSQDGAFVQTKGSIRVPLYLLGRVSVELHFEGRERRESEFSNWVSDN